MNWDGRHEVLAGRKEERRQTVRGIEKSPTMLRRETELLV